MADTTKNLVDSILIYYMAAGEALGKERTMFQKIEMPERVRADQDFEVKVTVGPHPNTVEHSIRWIEIYFYEERRPFNPILISRANFVPGSFEPQVMLEVQLPKKGVFHALEYCNLDGLWSQKREVILDNLRSTPELSETCSDRGEARETSPTPCIALVQSLRSLYLFRNELGL